MQNYHDTVGSFPIGRMGVGFSYPNSPDPNRRTWTLSIMPYLEQGVLFSATNFSILMVRSAEPHRHPDSGRGLPLSD